MLPHRQLKNTLPVFVCRRFPSTSMVEIARSKNWVLGWCVLATFRRISTWFWGVSETGVVPGRAPCEALANPKASRGGSLQGTVAETTNTELCFLLWCAAEQVLLPPTWYTNGCLHASIAQFSRWHDKFGFNGVTVWHCKTTGKRRCRAQVTQHHQNSQKMSQTNTRATATTPAGHECVRPQAMF